jgi:hypothetical protein
MNHFKHCLAVVSVLAIAAGSASAAIELPFGDSFENTAAPGVLAAPWSYTAVGEHTTDEAFSGSQSAYSSDEVTLSINDGIDTHSNVWWTGYAKVTAMDDSGGNPDLGDNAAAFYINTDGDVVANSNTSWIVYAEGLTIADWHGFSAHLDYQSGTWDLYIATPGAAPGDPMTKLNTGGPLLLNTGRANTELLECIVEGTTHLDDVAVSHDAAGTVVDAGTQDNAINASVELYLNGNLTGLLSQYFSEADSTMDGPLGRALYGALADGDKVHIFVDGTWYVFTHQGPGSGWGGGAPGISVLQTTAVWIQLLGLAAERNPAMTLAYDGTASDPVDVVLNGTGTLANGWTALAWPSSSSGSFANPGAGGMELPDAVQGDRVYIYGLLPSGRYGYTLIVWDASGGGRWEDRRGNAATAALTQGTAFWYFRNHADPANWNADQL